MESLIRLFVSILVICVLALLIKRSKCLDNEGVLASSVMGFLLLYFCGFKYLVLLLSFFVLGVLVSRIGLEKKKAKKMDETCRGLRNVLANGLIPILFAILVIFGFNWALIGYISSIAAATSDTFSSELGVLSNEKPRLITTFEVVDKGTDGAITIFGTLAGILGAFLMGLFAYLLFGDIKIVICSTVGGVAGNLADSLAGAIFERKGLLNNEHVNLIATLVGGVVGILIYYV
jgi:uncharacterized protein (TIGR00297 family)